MSKLSIAGLFLTVLLSSCGDATNTASTELPTAPMGPTETPKYTKGAKMDPICEMEWDTAWVESTVYQGDTIRFCSENCKTAFLARPEKYVK
jgi:YHS domain-containing protein